MVASICAVAANITFNALTYRTLRAPGLALGTTLAALVNLFILRVAFRRVVGRARQGGARERLSVIFATATLGLAAAGGWRLVRPVLAAVAARAPRAVGSARGLLLLATIAVSFSVYVAVLRLLGHPAAAELWRLPGKVLRRFRR
jgi:peptidoglycan biosynthesis protein MviN/MurJ (putative lipid II flippase)